MLFYLAVAAGAVTHEDLFFERPVKLPFLNVDLPLLAFFFVAPNLFIIVHAHRRVHLVMLSDKAKRFDAALHQQIGNQDGLTEQQSDRREMIRASLRRQLPINIFVQLLLGRRTFAAGLFGLSLRAIAWITLVITPILLLLIMQVQFLPFHSSFITWTQRLLLFVDLILIWWLWGRSCRGATLGIPAIGGPRWSHLSRSVSALASSFFCTHSVFSQRIAGGTSARSRSCASKHPDPIPGAASASGRDRLRAGLSDYLRSV